MSPRSAEFLLVIFFAAAPGLLVIRWWRPRWFPRWAVLASAALLGGATYYAREYVQLDAMTAVARNAGMFSVPPQSYVEGMVRLQNPRPVEFLVGAVLQLVYMLLWLVPYGVARILVDRRTRGLV